MSRTVKISCIIPTLNRGNVLCDTIEMLLTQSYPAHEIIVVDQTLIQDSTTRGRLFIWNQRGVIRWLHQVEPNASRARNAGALAATGDVLLFLDDDICVKMNFLAAYSEVFSRTGATAVAGQVLEGDAKPVDALPKLASRAEIGWLYFPKNYSGECYGGFMMAGNTAVMRSAFFGAGGMDENYRKGAFREESDFAQRFVRRGGQIYYSGICSIVHLGVSNVVGGGARSWSGRRDFGNFHHCVGDWYFNIRFAKAQTFWRLFRVSLQAFVVNRATRRRPGIMICKLFYWLAAAPCAVWLRLRGPRLCFGALSKESLQDKYADL